MIMAGWIPTALKILVPRRRSVQPRQSFAAQLTPTFAAAGLLYDPATTFVGITIG